MWRTRVRAARGEVGDTDEPLAFGRAVAAARARLEFRVREFEFDGAPATVARAVGGPVAERVLVAQLFENLTERVVERAAPRSRDVAPAALRRKILQPARAHHPIRSLVRRFADVNRVNRRLRRDRRVRTVVRRGARDDLYG